MPSLLLTIRFHDGRYHGVPDWPPSPSRLFQALVAAAARGVMLPDDAKSALEWLERLEAPVVAAPSARRAKGFNNFVPNNDLDAVGGDHRRIGEIRAAKRIHPWLFDAETPLLYAWSFEESGEASAYAEKISDIALDLYQLGRGVDMAWAWGETVPEEVLAERLAGYPGAVYRPSMCAAHGGNALACPQIGSLVSLIDRHQKSGERFETLFEPTKKNPGEKKPSGQLFKQPPKPRFRQAAYDCPPAYLLFELQGADAPWPPIKTAALTERIRDCAAQRLTKALPDKAGCIDKVFIGRNSTETDKAARICVIPLLSIGHDYADHAIRRVLIEVPPNCPINADDIEWAFSGLSPFVDEETGEILLELIPASTRKMLEHYGVENDEPARLWRTVTPAAFPVARRRIEPRRIREEAKGGKERAKEDALAAGSVLQALRHAGVTAPVSSVRVQREPFEAKGVRAEAFAPETRFPKERLWHAEIAFAEPVAGPHVIGDGRYLGLGLLRPAKMSPEKAFVFDIARDKFIPVNRRVDFLRAVRRALMALDRDYGRGDGVSRLFSGHEDDGAPARSGTHDHVFLAATADVDKLSKLYVFSPTLADRRKELAPAEQRRFSEIVRKLELIRAGQLGVIELIGSSSPLANSVIIRPSREWVSETAYIPTRHLKSKNDRTEWLTEDVLRECARRGLPRPEIEILSFEMPAKSKPGVFLRLTFETQTFGPILIGQGAHLGSGLFHSCAP